MPEIDRISLIGGKTDASRVPFVRMKGVPHPFPLKRLGDGVNRLFALALALVHAKGGLLLLDEIENGIHYSLQENVWTFILEISRRLDIQVFATTHSWDCVVAFQSASASYGAQEGLLTRLERRNGRIVVTQFDESDLKVAEREQIEVR
jgi:predicted ATPase